MNSEHIDLAIYQFLFLKEFIFIKLRKKKILQILLERRKLNSKYLSRLLAIARERGVLQSQSRAFTFAPFYKDINVTTIINQNSELKKSIYEGDMRGRFIRHIWNKCRLPESDECNRLRLQFWLRRAAESNRACLRSRPSNLVCWWRWLRLSRVRLGRCLYGFCKIKNSKEWLSGWSLIALWTKVSESLMICQWHIAKQCTEEKTKIKYVKKNSPNILSGMIC